MPESAVFSFIFSIRSHLAGLKQLTQGLRQTAQQQWRFNRQLYEQQRAQRTASRAAARTAASLEALGKQGRQAEGSFGRLSFRMMFYGFILTALGGKLLVTKRLMVSWFEAAQKFQKQLYNLAAVTIEGTERLGEFQQIALKVAAITPYGPAEVAEAMFEMAKAGMEVKGSLETVLAVADMAFIAEMSMAEAAQFVARTLSTFSKQSLNARRAVDVITRGVLNSAYTFEDFQQVLANAGAVAAALGQRLEDVIVTATYLAQKGFRPSVAGTIIRSFAAVISDPTKAKLLKQIAYLGIEAGGVMAERVARILMTKLPREPMKGIYEFYRGKVMKPLWEIALDIAQGIDQTIERLEQMGATQYQLAQVTEEFNGILEQTFGRRAVRMVMAFRGANRETMIELQRRIEEAAGAAARFRETTMQSFAGVKRYLEGTIAGLSAIFGDLYLRVLTPIIKGIAEFANVGRVLLTTAEGQINVFGRLIPAWVALGTAAIATVGIFAIFGGTLGILIDRLRDMGHQMARTAGGLLDWSKALNYVSVGLRPFKPLLIPILQLLKGFGWIIAGISVALAAWEADLAGIRTMVSYILAPLKDLLLGTGRLAERAKALKKAFVESKIWEGIREGIWAVGMAVKWTLVYPLTMLLRALGEVMLFIERMVKWLTELGNKSRILGGALKFLGWVVGVYVGLFGFGLLNKALGTAFAGLSKILRITKSTAGWFLGLGRGAGAAYRGARLLIPIFKLLDLMMGGAIGGLVRYIGKLRQLGRIYRYFIGWMDVAQLRRSILAQFGLGKLMLWIWDRPLRPLRLLTRRIIRLARDLTKLTRMTALYNAVIGRQGLLYRRLIVPLWGLIKALALLTAARLKDAAAAAFRRLILLMEWRMYRRLALGLKEIIIRLMYLRFARLKDAAAAALQRLAVLGLAAARLKDIAAAALQNVAMATQGRLYRLLGLRIAAVLTKLVGLRLARLKNLAILISHTAAIAAAELAMKAYAAATWLATTAQSAFSLSLLRSVILRVGAWLAKLGAWIKGLKIIRGLMVVLRPLIIGIGAALSPLAGLIAGVIAAIGGAFYILFTNTWHARDRLMDFWRLITGFFRSIFEGIRRLVRRVKSGFGSIGRAVGEAIGAIGRMPAAIKRFIVGIPSGLVSIGQAIADSIISGMRTAWQKIKDFFADIGGLIGSAVQEVASSLYEQGRGMVQSLLEGIKSAWEAVRDFFAGIGETISHAVGGAAIALYEASKGAVFSLTEGFRSAWAETMDFFAGIGGVIVGAVKKVFPAIYEAGKGVVLSLLEGLKSAWGGVADFFRMIGRGIQEGFEMILALGRGETYAEQLAQQIHEQITTAVQGFLRGAREMIVKSFQLIKEELTTFFTSTLPAFFTQQVPAVLGQVEDLFRRGFTSISQAISGLGESLYESGRKVIEALLRGSQAAWESAVGFFSALPGQIAGFFASLSQKIAISFQQAIQSITSWGQQVFNEILASLQRVGEAIVNYFTGLPAQLTASIQGLLQQARQAGSAVGQAFLERLQAAWQSITGFFTELGQGLYEQGARLLDSLIEGIKSSWTAVRDAFLGLPELIKGTFVELGQWFYERGVEFLNSFIKGVRAGWRAVKELFLGLPGMIAGTFTQLGSWFYEQGRTALSRFATGVAEFWDPIVETFRRLPEKIKEAFVGFGQWFYEQGKTVLASFGAGIAAFWDSIIGVFRRLLESIKEIFTGIGEWFYEVGKSMLNSLVEGAKAAWERVKEFFLGVAKWFRAILPFSPAKIGPLKDLDKAGRGYVETIREGVISAARKLKPITLEPLIRVLAPAPMPAAAGGIPAPALAPAPAPVPAPVTPQLQPKPTAVVVHVPPASAPIAPARVPLSEVRVGQITINVQLPAGTEQEQATRIAQITKRILESKLQNERYLRREGALLREVPEDQLQL